MSITTEHAEKRIKQISEICLKMVAEHEAEALADNQELLDIGVEADIKPVGVGGPLYAVWHSFIRFYSQFL